MENRILTCICCPIGCQIDVILEDKEIVEIKGNNCKRGYDYAKTETVSPVRVVTSTMKVLDGVHPVVSVKTQAAIPKGKIFDCMNEINSTYVKAPVQVGDVLIRDVLGTGVNIIATKNIDMM